MKYEQTTSLCVVPLFRSDQFGVGRRAEVKAPHGWQRSWSDLASLSAKIWHLLVLWMMQWGTQSGKKRRETVNIREKTPKNREPAR